MRQICAVDAEEVQGDGELQKRARDQHREVIRLRETMEAAFKEEKHALKENVAVLISTLGFFLQGPDTYSEVSLRKTKRLWQCGQFRVR